MDHLPVDTLLQIFQFLNLHELPQLQLLSRNLHDLLRSPKFQFALFQSVLNTDRLLAGCSEPLLQRWMDCLQCVFRQKPRELPFWGESTNGGVYSTHLRFWIGKSFLKSSRPNLVLEAGRNCHISGMVDCYIGWLAKDYFEFRESLLEVARYHNYDNDYEPIPQHELIIIDAFMGCFNSHAFQLLEEDEDIQKYQHAHSLLIDYINRTSNALLLQQNERNIRIDAVKLERMACLFSLQLSRNLNHTNPAQKLFVMISPSPSLPATAQAQLDLIRQGSQFSRVYSRVVSAAIDQRDPVNGHADYILFDRNPFNIVAYVDMHNCEAVRISLPLALRVWTNQLCLHFIEGRVTSPAASNISIEYCSASGIMLKPPEP